MRSGGVDLLDQWPALPDAWIWLDISGTPDEAEKTLLAGIYGMNFQFMPELSWHYGYFGTLGIMAVIVVTLITVFKRRNWL